MPLQKNKVVVGIDIGGTTSKIGVVDQSGNISASAVVPTPESEDPAILIKEISRSLINLLPGGFDNTGIQAVGVGAPNASFFRGTISFAPNLNFAKNREVDFAGIFLEITGHKPVLTNDANAAAIGEKIFGGASEMDDFMVITVGTGLGSGIYVKGALLYGSDGLAGEVGHTVFQRDGRPCKCGKYGCIETYVSASGLVNTFRELSTNPPEVETPYDIYEIAQTGGEDAIRAFKLTGERLGIHLADMAAIFSPEAIFISGGLISAGEFLLEPAEKAFDANLMKHHKGKIPLRISELKNQQTAILGAAALGWDSIRKHEIR